MVTWIQLLQLNGAVAKFQTKSRPAFKSSDDILAKMWGSVRASNGIKVLLSLLMVKTPLVDADCIRSLACKALCGLSRSDKIRQVIGKLQLFNSGQLQSKCSDMRYCLYQNDLHLDASNVFRSCYPEKFKNAKINSRFGFVFKENSVRGNQIITVFEKFSVH